MPQNIQVLIKFLITNGFRAECSQCSDKMHLSKTPLFDAKYFTASAKELLKERCKTDNLRNYIDNIINTINEIK